MALKVYSKAQFEKPIYGIGRITFVTKENKKTGDLVPVGFTLTAKIEEDGEQVSKSWKFDGIEENLPENVPSGFELEEKVKYAFVLSSDESTLKFIRPANLRGANFKFAGFLQNEDGDYSVQEFDALDKEKQPTGKKIIKFKALWDVVNPPYAGFQYPQALPFTNSYGQPHFQKKGKDWSVQGNAEWKGKKTQYGGLIDFLNATGISDGEIELEVPKSLDPQDWLAALEQCARECNRVVVGCDTTDGYISAWGESIPDESKTKKKVSKRVIDEDDDEEEAPAPKKPAPAKKEEVEEDEAPAPKKQVKKVVEPDDDDEVEETPAPKKKVAAKKQPIPDDDDD